MASRFAQSAWSQPELVSGTLMVDVVEDPPSLVFDGHDFIAAWSARENGKRFAYTARYKLATGWNAYQKQQTATDAATALKMPRLVSDGRGTLLLVYAAGTGSSFSLMYQRYANGAWGSINPVPGGSVSSQSFESNDTVSLSMSQNGLAALAWTDRDDGQYIKAIRLASFF
jgi:hypothetical protein